MTSPYPSPLRLPRRAGLKLRLIYGWARWRGGLAGVGMFVRLLWRWVRGRVP